MPTLKEIEFHQTILSFRQEADDDWRDTHFLRVMREIVLEAKELIKHVCLVLLYYQLDSFIIKISTSTYAIPPTSIHRSPKGMGNPGTLTSIPETSEEKKSDMGRPSASRILRLFDVVLQVKYC
jgi:hypothetical protein